MSITAYSTTPSSIINRIRNGISRNEIRTWIFDRNGYMRYTVPQYQDIAWVHPSIQRNSVVFEIEYDDEDLNLGYYGIFYGRLIEILISHCFNIIDYIKIE